MLDRRQFLQVAAAVAAVSLALIVFAARSPERLRDVMGRVAGVLPVGVAGSDAAEAGGGGA